MIPCKEWRGGYPPPLFFSCDLEKMEIQEQDWSSHKIEQRNWPISLDPFVSVYISVKDFSMLQWH